MSEDATCNADDTIWFVALSVNYGAASWPIAMSPVFLLQQPHADANVLAGATFDGSLDGIIRVSVVATGVDINAANNVRAVVSPTRQRRRQRLRPCRRRLRHNGRPAHREFRALKIFRFQDRTSSGRGAVNWRRKIIRKNVA
jgi:hypothetical protein